MHGQSQTPNLPDDSVLGRAAVRRSGQPQDPRHRFGADADSSGLREGQKGAARAALTEALERAQGLLEEVQADRLVVPGQA